MRFAIANGLVLAGCAGVTDNTAVATTVCGAQCRTISHELTSWGRPVYRSQLSADGTLVSEKPDFNANEVSETIRRKLSAEG